MTMTIDPETRIRDDLSGRVDVLTLTRKRERARIWRRHTNLPPQARGGPQARRRESQEPDLAFGDPGKSRFSISARIAQIDCDFTDLGHRFCYKNQTVETH
jgi:hypothetical protein